MTPASFPTRADPNFQRLTTSRAHEKIMVSIPITHARVMGVAPYCPRIQRKIFDGYTSVDSKVKKTVVDPCTERSMWFTRTRYPAQTER